MTTAPTTALTLTPERRAIADRVIAAMAGDDAKLRSDQETAVAALCEPSARVLVVQATGWGKSAVYWAATAVRRAEGHGTTLVVSPLLALMRDQVAAAARAGLTAATLNSSNVTEWTAIEEQLLAGSLDVLLVSPERLANPRFANRVLDALVGRLGLLVVDEAHAISDWGHDFRPDYRRVADLLRGLHPTTPVLATTATANARVTDDVAAQLGETTLVCRGRLARDSLHLAVLGELSPLERYAWVVDHLPRLPGSGIVYALTVADAERLATVLQAVHGASLRVAAYTGGLEPETRERLEDGLRSNQLKALVATSALGMGYDKPDLGFVVHVGSPPSPVSYYQQVGRAGRGIDEAQVILLPSTADAGVWDYFATATIPDADQVNRLISAWGREGDETTSIPALEAISGVRRGRVELLLKQLAVDCVVERVEDGWRLTGRAWVYDAEHYDGIIATRRREAEIMRAYSRGESCLMQLLQESLDDPTAQPCGRCTVCRGGLPDGLAGVPARATVTDVSRRLRGESHTLESRKLWPGGEFGSRGRIPDEVMADEGRVLIHANAPEWREFLAGGVGPGTTATSELLDGCVALMSRWRSQWAERPEVVVGLAAAGAEELVEQVCAHIASVGRLDATLIPSDGSAPDGLASASEAAWWRDRISVGPETRTSVAGRPVLLVVDASSSMWPVTIAAAALREAGAKRVLPLVVHRRVG
ncbi:MAG TPA: DEAD/DEAH box helicase [Nocardioidaceae bacterium]